VLSEIQIFPMSHYLILAKPGLLVFGRYVGDEIYNKFLLFANSTEPICLTPQIHFGYK
jgi:hypothetical protein